MLAYNSCCIFYEADLLFADSRQLDKILIETHALTYVGDTNMLVWIMNCSELSLIQIDGRKSQNIICDIGKSSRISSCGQEEGHYCNIREVFMKKSLHLLECLAVEIGRLTVIALNFFYYHAVFFADCLDFFKTAVKVILADASYKHNRLSQR